MESKINEVNLIDEKISENQDSNDERNFERSSYDLQSTKILSNIENILKTMYTETENEIKFKLAAIVLNRFFFILSIIYIIVTFSVFVLSVSNFYNFR